MTPLALTPDQMEEARQLYALHDWPAGDIAEHFGVSETAVRNALKHMGVEIRPRNHEPPPLRMKQCACCLRFLPIAMFAGRDATRARLASWCNNCTNHPPAPKWHPNAAPLAQVLTQWSRN